MHHYRQRALKLTFPAIFCKQKCVINVRRKWFSMLWYVVKNDVKTRIVVCEMLMNACKTWKWVQRIPRDRVWAMRMQSNEVSDCTSSNYGAIPNLFDIYDKSCDECGKYYGKFACERVTTILSLTNTKKKVNSTRIVVHLHYLLNIWTIPANYVIKWYPVIRI